MILADLWRELLLTLADVLPIVAVVGFFQFAIIRRAPLHARRLIVGGLCVIVGLTLFRFGLGTSLLPMGRLMGEQLAASVAENDPSRWWRHGWLYAFAMSIGFSSALIEPTVITIAQRVQDLTGGTIRAIALRLAIAFGMGAGLLLGTIRIVTGIPLEYMLVPVVIAIAVLAVTSPKAAVPLALDSGAMATSVVTVPLIAAFGVALASYVPGRDPVSDGFGFIVLALLLPMASLLGYARLSAWREGRRQEQGA